MVCGGWYFAPTVCHTGAVFLNDRMIYEAVTLEECISDTADPVCLERGRIQLELVHGTEWC